MPVSASLPYDEWDLTLTPSSDMVAPDIDFGEGQGLLPSEERYFNVRR